MARYINTPKTSLKGINAELVKVQDAFEDVLDRRGDGANFLDTDLDMNSRRILNLPSPVLDQEPLRKGDAFPFYDQTESFRDEAVQAAEESVQAAEAAQASASSAQGALDELLATVTTQDLINGSMPSLEVGSTITTTGFYTAGDGGGAKWLLTSNTNTPSQSPAQLGDVKLTDSGGREWVLVIAGIVKPRALGAGLGDDDGVILNSCFQWLRDNVNQSGSVAGLDGEMGSYRTTISINATKIVGWNWFIKNMDIYGENSGTIILDCIGSRGGTMENVTTEGDEVNTPSAGIVFARAAQSGFKFASHWKIKSVSTLGYYSVAGFMAYGQETTDYDTCKFWNYNPNARAAVFTGTDGDVSITSQYAPPITGGTSYINNTYSNVDARYLPAGNTTPITGISKSNPCVVSVTTTRSWVAGDKVSLGSISGMTELNNKSYEIANVTSNSFELVGVDSTSFGSYTSNGTVFLSNSVPPVYFARAKGHIFSNLYIVSYGAPHLEVSNIGDLPIAKIDFECLFEGFGSSSHLLFSNLNTDLDLIDINIGTYNTHANESFIETQGSGSVNVTGGEISVTNFAYEDLKLLADPSKFKMYGTNITYPSYELVESDLMSLFSGCISSEGQPFKSVSSNPVLNYTPTVTSSSGSIGSYTVDYYKYKITDGVVKASASITITDIGTATGNIFVTNPITPTSAFVTFGRENAATAESLQVLTNANRTTVTYLGGGGFQTGYQLLINPEYY